eukprot:6907879-Lingulodinium_polyedra.AAC.1
MELAAELRGRRLDLDLRRRRRDRNTEADALPTTSSRVSIQSSGSPRTASWRSPRASRRWRP